MDQRQKSERTNLILKLLMALLFVTGAIIFSYPFVADAVNNFYDQKMLAKVQDENNEAIKRQEKARLKELEEKNKQMKGTNIPGMGIVKDPFEDAVGDAQNPGRKYYEKHTIGAIYIPEIEVSLPLFDTTTPSLLEKGATVLQGTSFPVGGKSTHAVITGHTGLPDKLLFTDLDKLKKGDPFYLKVEGKKLAYQVDKIQVVLPDALDKLVIQENRDLVTLVTCTPYGVNSHRLLVTGHRIPFKEPAMDKEMKKTEDYHKKRFWLYVAGITLFFVLLFYWIWRKFVFYQSGKYHYDFCFALSNQQSGIPVQLIGKHKKVIAETTSESNGQVCFRKIRGGKYKAVSPDEKFKGYVFKLKDTHFKVRKLRRWRKK